MSVNRANTTQGKRSSANLHSCSLDLNSPSSRRKAQSDVARRVAQKRMFHANSHDLAADGTKVVHRSGQTDYSYECQDYTQIEFLNQHEVVLAGDSKGSIDIIRLPRYCPPDDDNDEQHRPLGTMVAGKVEMNDTAMDGASGSYRLKSLNEGRAFVAGYSSGTFALYATEHSSSLIRLSATRDVVQQTGLGSLALRGNTFASPNTGRNWDYYLQSIRRMFQTCDVSQWERSAFPRKVNSSWDFHETPSGLLAAFVDFKTNSLTLFDERMSQGYSHRSVVLLDRESKNDPGHIVSPCFVSDHCLATLHLWIRPCETKSTTAVKIWDIRMTKKSTPVVESPLPTLLCNGEHTMTADSTMELDNQVSWSNIPAQVHLTPSNNGYIMATVVSQKTGAESYLLDPTRASIVKHFCTPSSVNAILAVAPTLGCLACYDMPSLSLYDLPMKEDTDECHRNRGLKRSRDSETSNREMNRKNLIGTMTPTIQDVEGIRSRLQCLTFNETGTSLVGGTNDGDLFLWRGG